MEQNKAELIGKINHKELKEHTNCKIAKFLIGKQIRENEWVSFPVTLFNDEAVKAYNLLDKKDYGYFSGKLSMSSYVVNEKKIDKMEFLAFEAKKVKYDTDQKKYVEIKAAEGIEDWE